MKKHKVHWLAWSGDVYSCIMTAGHIQLQNSCVGMIAEQLNSKVIEWKAGEVSLAVCSAYVQVCMSATSRFISKATGIPRLIPRSHTQSC